MPFLSTISERKNNTRCNDLQVFDINSHFFRISSRIRNRVPYLAPWVFLLHILNLCSIDFPFCRANCVLNGFHQYLQSPHSRAREHFRQQLHYPESWANCRSFCFRKSHQLNMNAYWTYPCDLLSATKSLKERPTGAMNKGFPVTES